MAGEDNLTPARSKEEARVRGSNGGKRSGEVRREKKIFSVSLKVTVSLSY